MIGPYIEFKDNFSCPRGLDDDKVPWVCALYTTRHLQVCSTRFKCPVAREQLKIRQEKKHTRYCPLIDDKISRMVCEARTKGQLRYCNEQLACDVARELLRQRR